ncbi:aldehyde oxidase GLOX-like [Rhododendron vialii]|uniref:aldehyde oxidase GLOX-like n=1 Tax=Rhododendron vialii TaxID=182163 RepID=UPI00265F4D32|nr:aldehyde oxidase GLOX-like [Rhododendron vialii]
MAAPIFFCLQLLCFAFTVIRTRAQPPGTWELLVQNAGIASMHTAVTRWNTVVLIDRTDIGASNLSLPNGVCRIDPNDLALTTDCYAHSALLDLETNTIRPLMILTDTWCSSGHFLPDGTLLHSGGWNDGNTKFRTFTPCINTSACDWEELPNTTSLYQGRWYATNQILPDGSIIIVGGIGISSVEYYPPKPGGAINFPFLANAGDNEGDNMYPYVHLLPQGNLFIFANNQSVLYDYVNNTIVLDFPQLEGGPRSYPSAGSSAMLALEGNYSTATIIICGGAQYDAFNNQSVNSTAKGSCGRIVATDPNPVWEMEEMPLVRIMGDMVMLPTGDILIINGAQAGSQGYGLATNPCLNPVLYQPDQPEGSRFMTLNPGSIPRLYHSTANLLPDGRVLLAGSNTHYYYTFDWDFPTELRIEAFSPEYLAADNVNLRPVVTKTPKTVQYGNLYNVYVTVLSPILEDCEVEVNFASAPFATHSFSQGQRLVKLGVTRVVSQVNGDYRIVFQAPPNGMVAPPGYYMMFVVNQGVPSVARWVQLTS